MLTIFTIPKAFDGHTGLIQRNAIRSWLQLQPLPEVILFGDDAGTADVASAFHLRHVPNVERNKYGTPLINGLFSAAERLATNPLLCYVNADIILMTDFLDAVRQVTEHEPQSLMICRRWDVDLNEELDFHAGSEQAIRSYVMQNGRRRPHTAIDCFVFSRGLWKDIPPFALGRGMWDNWLIFGARANHSPVIDLSEVVLAVHQNHDYSHQGHSIRTEADVWVSEEAKYNWTLGGGYAYAFSAYDATHVLTRRGLKRNITPYSLYRTLALLSVSRPFLASLVDLMRLAYGKFNALRRGLLWRVKL